MVTELVFLFLKNILRFSQFKLKREAFKALKLQQVAPLMRDELTCT